MFFNLALTFYLQAIICNIAAMSVLDIIHTYNKEK